MEIQFSSLKRRFAAMFLDSIILTTFISVWEDFSYVDDILLLIIPILYFVFFYLGWNGQTIGKRILSIKVVRVDNQPIILRTAFVRTIGYYLSTIPVFLGFLWALWDKDKQTFHDKMAKTYVVKTETSPNRMLWIILVVFLMFAGLFSFGMSIIYSFKMDSTTVTEQETQGVSTKTSVRSELNLEYMQYDGTGDASLIEAFDNPDLEEVVNSIQELGEGFVATGDGNMNIAGGDTITLDKESTVYIKLTTDTEVAAFIFTKENLDNFVKEQERQEDPFGFKQSATDFLPSYELKSSYTELLLEAGTYQLVIVPTEKAVTIDAVVKIK